MPGRALGIAPFAVDRAMLLDYLAEVRESESMYRAEGLVHPGQILRLANMALVQNVVLGPWIYVGSKVNNLAPSTSGNASRCGRRSHRMWSRRDIRLSNSMPL